jgi:hypothetical protein
MLIINQDTVWSRFESQRDVQRADARPLTSLGELSFP